MRHRKAFNHLSRKRGHRKAMLANMASSLIMHKKIETTTAKAKALRTYVEPLITKSKDDTTTSRRVVFSYLQNKDAVSELFREVSPKVMDRPGGYTRILKLGTRLGDNAEMCIIELVDYNENLLASKQESAGKSTRRRRRGGKGKGTQQQQETAAKAESPVAPAEEQATEKAEETKPEAATTATEEVKEEPKAETKEETSAEETKAEATVEEAKEEPKDEVKAEPAKEAAAEDVKEEDTAAKEIKAEAADETSAQEEKKEEKADDKKADNKKEE